MFGTDSVLWSPAMLGKIRYSRTRTWAVVFSKGILGVSSCRNSPSIPGKRILLILSLPRFRKKRVNSPGRPEGARISENHEIRAKLPGHKYWNFWFLNFKVQIPIFLNPAAVTCDSRLIMRAVLAACVRRWGAVDQCYSSQ